MCLGVSNSGLRFRTAGFPRYGSKAGLSGGAFPRGVHVLRRPVCLRPSCAPWQTCNPRSASGTPARACTAMRESSSLPQGPSLRSGLFCPGPSTLNRPHPPHAQAHRHFTAWRLIGDAFAVPAGLGDPRVVPCFRRPPSLGMPPPETPESSSAACAQFLRRRRWPSPRFDGFGTLETPAIRFRRGTNFGATWFAQSLRPVELFASLCGSDCVPCRTPVLRSSHGTGVCTVAASGFFRCPASPMLRGYQPSETSTPGLSAVR
jgi:hypothetical protein